MCFSLFPEMKTWYDLISEYILLKHYLNSNYEIRLFDINISLESNNIESVDRIKNWQSTKEIKS